MNGLYQAMPAIHLSDYQTVNKFIILQSHVFLLSYFCSKKRSIGVVEPRVVVKIPLAPKVRGADTGKFLQEPTLHYVVHIYIYTEYVHRSLARAFF